MYANSLALLSDAAYMFMDVFALVLTYATIRIVKRLSSLKVLNAAGTLFTELNINCS